MQLMGFLIECPICQSIKAKSLYKYKGADVVECLDCAMIYVPMPTPEVTSIYKESYFENNGENAGYSNYRAELLSHLITFDKRIEESEKIMGHKGRLLDLGCALGHLGEAAKRRGWDAYVTDVSEYAVLETRKNFGLNGFISAPDKLAVKSEKFDLITMFDVIEHLSHPMELLHDIHRALARGGLLQLTTPNAQSISAKIMGRSWFHLKPNEHLLYFTPNTISAVLKRAGLEVVAIKPMPTYMRIQDILLRLERYSKTGSSVLSKIASWLGIADIRLKIFIGEMQVWAKKSGVQAVNSIKKTEPIKDILDIVCCTNCRSELQLFEDSEAICTQCELSFEVTEGVINFSKYAKRKKQKIVGSS